MNMVVQSKARLTALGSSVPTKKLTNFDLEKLVETNDEWIVQRTGMKERRIAGEDEYTSHLCIQAVQNLMENYQKDIADVDLIIVSTTTADYHFPSVACRIQEAFSIPHTAAFDLNATCAGFAYALHVANGFITSGLHKKVLVVGGETLSKVTDYKDRTSCILFGDGAGAALVEYEENPEYTSFLATVYGTEGKGGIHLYRTGLSSSMDGTALSGEGNMVQNGREVYKWAVTNVPLGVRELLLQAKLDIEDVDWFVPHSANLRMIESICEKTELPIEKVLHSLEFLGNTSSASIPLALHLGLLDNKLKFGDTLIAFGFGGGLTYTGHVLRWTVPDTPLKSFS